MGLKLTPVPEKIDPPPSFARLKDPMIWLKVIIPKYSAQRILYPLPPQKKEKNRFRPK